MCGIIGISVNSPNHIKRDTYQVYRNQQYRGKQGFGLAIKHLNGGIERVRTRFEHEIFKEPLWDNIQEGDLVLFHHRIPTSSPNIPACNHPLANSTQTLFLAHNGIITGYDELNQRNFESKIELNEDKKFGWKHYDDFTDSELCLHRLDDLLLKNDMLVSVKVLGEENFFSAFLIFHANEHKIYFVSNGADLNYYKFRDNKFISSLPYNKKFEEIDYTFGYINGEENVIKPLERAYYQTFTPGYWSKDSKDKGFYDDSALEESYFFDCEREMLDSQLFARFKEEHGCKENCAKCDHTDDCLDLFKEWRHQEYESDINSW